MICEYSVGIKLGSPWLFPSLYHNLLTILWYMLQLYATVTCGTNILISDLNMKFFILLYDIMYFFFVGLAELWPMWQLMGEEIIADCFWCIVRAYLYIYLSSPVTSQTFYDLSQRLISLLKQFFQSYNLIVLLYVWTETTFPVSALPWILHSFKEGYTKSNANKYDMLNGYLSQLLINYCSFSCT